MPCFYIRKKSMSMVLQSMHHQHLLLSVKLRKNKNNDGY